MLQAMVRAREEVDVTTLAAAIREGAPSVAEYEVGVAIAVAGDSLRESVGPALLDAMRAAGRATASAATAAGAFRASSAPVVRALGVSPVVSFQLNNPRAIAWAKERAASLVTGLSAETRDVVLAALRDVMGRSLSEGIAPMVSARLIRAQVGLLDRQAAAVRKLRAVLSDQKNFGRLVRAGKTRIRVPRGGMPLDLVQKRCEQYSARLLNQRTLMIARTETIACSEGGQREAWLQARDDGYIPKDQKREWHYTPIDGQPECDVCAPLNNEVVGLDEPFSSGDYGPPAHPHCGCYTTLSGSPKLSFIQQPVLPSAPAPPPPVDAPAARAAPDVAPPGEAMLDPTGFAARSHAVEKLDERAYGYTRSDMGGDRLYLYSQDAKKIEAIANALDALPSEYLRAGNLRGGFYLEESLSETGRNWTTLARYRMQSGTVEIAELSLRRDLAQILGHEVGHSIRGVSNFARMSPKLAADVAKMSASAKRKFAYFVGSSDEATVEAMGYIARGVKGSQYERAFPRLFAEVKQAMKERNLIAQDA